MGRLIRYLIYLAILVAIGLAIYASLFDLSIDRQPVSIDVQTSDN